MSKVLHGMIVSSGNTACGLFPCAPGVCANPQAGCHGTRLLDYKGVPMTGFGDTKVPAHPTHVEAVADDLGVPGISGENGWGQHD